MAKYRKKPIEVEAVKLGRETWGEVCDFLTGDSAVSAMNPGYYLDSEGKYTADMSDTFAVQVMTAQGQWIEVKNGEWIIAEGPDHPGRFYPCEPGIFEATYEAVEG